MNVIRLGRTGVEIPTVGLGSWSFGGPNVVQGRPVGWYGADEAEARRTMARAWRFGMTHWDTADVYGDGRSEKLIGSMWTEIARDQIFLASKVGWDPGNHSHFYHPAQMRRQLERSLRNLATDHLDLYYLHHCDFGPNDEHLEDALALMRTFRDEGKVRFVGLSDWKSENILRLLDAVDPDVVQCYRNVVDDDYASSGLRAAVEERDLGVIFFSPLKHSLLLGIFEGPVTFGEGDHRAGLPEFRDYGLITRLRACRREIERRFAGVEEPMLHALIGALLTDAPTGATLIGQRLSRHADAAAKVGEPLAEDDAEWVRRLFQENGRLTRASWKAGYNTSTG
ncbi:MAG: aldo/keto reductase [Acidobacteriota bacterium]